MTREANLPGTLGDVQRRLKKGYTIERTGGKGGHYRVRDPKGELVQYQGKNLTLTGTGRSDAVSRMETALKRTQVLAEHKPRKEPRISDEAKQRRAEALRKMIEQRNVKRQAVATQLLERLSAAVDHVGGMDLPGMHADLAYVGSVIARDLGYDQMTPDLLTSSVKRVAEGNWVEGRYQEVWNALAERLENADDLVDEWFALVRQARGLPEDVVDVRTPMEGDWPFRVELLPVDALLVDHDYQRPVPWPFVRKLAASYDESLVGTIDVAERRRGAVFAILDGQLRFEASKLVGKQTVWASIYSGLDKQSEARFFLHKNRDRKAVHPFYTFKARVTAGDEDAIEIDRIVRAHGYELAIGAPGQGREKNIAAIAAIENAYKRKLPDGSDALTPVLRTLRASTWGRSNGQNSVIIRGLASIYQSSDGQVDEQTLTSIVTQLGPDLILGRARDAARGSGGNASSACARVLTAEYNRNLPRGVQRLSRSA